MKRDLKTSAQIRLDESGQVLLSDDDLKDFIDTAEIPAGGGTNNVSCNNARDCTGSINSTSCVNSGSCEGSLNSPNHCWDRAGQVYV
jgi:hypothetical protein